MSSPAGGPGRWIGVDTGGTFTDVVEAGGGWRVTKVASDPLRPERPLGAALGAWDPGQAAGVLHGTTVATNALLEGRLARTAMVFSRGFADLLFVGRGGREGLYDLDPAGRSCPIHPEDGLCLELAERVGADGRVLLAPSEADLEEVARRAAGLGAEAVGVCLLFSWLAPAHERRLARRLRSELGARAAVCASSDLLPQIREVERAATTLANAALMPLMRGYMRRLARVAGRRPVAIMGSHAGLLAPRTAAEQPVGTILSGPAAGLLAARAVADRAGAGGILTLDMGGTSTDVAVCHAAPELGGGATVAGLPIAWPSLRLHTIGAGGGSLIGLAPGGMLRVGPGSAGAWPGPAAYGRGGTEATVTDANLVLGRLPAGLVLADGTRLDRAMAEAALARLARRAGLGIEDCALAALSLTDALMERALRRIAGEAGEDPRSLTLVPFGGAAGLHACALAEALDVGRVLVPAVPGALSALGLATSAPRAVAVQSLPPSLARASSAAAAGAVEAIFRRLEARARRDLARLGPAGAVRLERGVDMRYAGQSWDLAIAWQAAPPALRGAFEDLHRSRFGFSLPGQPVERVALRVTASVARFAQLPARMPAAPAPLVAGAPTRGRARFPDGEWREVAYVQRSDLSPGRRLAGPLVLLQVDSTMLLPPDWALLVLPGDDLLLGRA